MTSIIKNKKIVISFILILQLITIVSVCSFFSNKQETVQKLQKGKFEVRNTTFISNENELLVYSPSDKNFQAGRRIISSNKFLSECTLRSEIDEEIIGYYSTRSIGENDHLVFQFEAYTESGRGTLEYCISGNSDSVIIEERPKMFFIPITNIKKVGDIYFKSSDSVNKVILDRIYLINYSTTPYEKILLGSFYSDRVGEE